MPRKLTLSKSHSNLLKAIKAALTAGLLTAQKMLDLARLKTYWQIGKEITDKVAASKEELVLSDRLFVTISDYIYDELELEMSVDLLRRTVQFYRDYPVCPAGSTLTFAHYLNLMRVKDKILRSTLEKKCIKKNLSVPRLKEEISRLKPDGYQLEITRNNRLPVERGEPYVYYVSQGTGLDGKTGFHIDCGFKISVDIPAGNPYTPTHSGPVRSVKHNDSYTVHRYKNGLDKLYTYAATVTRVVDGDTFDVCIDVGFSIGLRDRLRLKGINAPESDTPSRQKSKKFLEKYFSFRPVIVLRSFKSEMYGRWLADVFSLENCSDPVKIAAEGAYLNQHILDQGLAELYRQAA